MKTAAGDGAGLVFTTIYFMLFMLSDAKQLPASLMLTTHESLFLQPSSNLVYIVATVMLISMSIEI